ncbi:hypothetical protein AB0C22_26490 [Micromonospora sp. NPDC048894]|uniref:hypothetical protein n=1 Tax=Micromonospora sp. NPDC048894 TaxID=3155493 RepID=UPI0033F2F6D6
MTYGRHLAQAATALATAQLALRQPEAGRITDHAAAAIARTHLYRALQRQVARFAGGSDQEFDRLLGRATENTTSDLPLPPPSHHPAAVALRQAADAVRAAGEIVDSQFDPSSGRPRSSDGYAILAGVDRSENLTHLARLARAAGEVDRPLARWLAAGYVDGSQQDVVRTALQDSRTARAVLYPAVRAVAARPSEQSPLRHLEPPPLTDYAGRWTSIGSPTDCVTALDVTRTWLVQHQHDLTAVDLRTLTRTSLALTYETGYLLTQATGRDTPSGAIGSLAAGWRLAARATTHLQSLTTAGPGVGPAVLAAAELWLRDRLRPDGGWRDPRELRATVDAGSWERLGRELAGRLPDFVTLVHRAARAALHRGDLLEPHRLSEASSITARSRWIRATTGSPRGVQVLSATSQLRRSASRIAREAGITVLPGIHEYDPQNTTNRTLRAQHRPSASLVPSASTRQQGLPAPPSRNPLQAQRSEDHRQVAHAHQRNESPGFGSGQDVEGLSP